MAKQIWPLANHIQRGPGDLEVIVALGLPPKEAHEALEDGLKYDPWNINYHLAKARLFALEQKPLEMTKEVELARRLSPVSALFRNGLAPNSGQGQSQLNLGQKGAKQ